MSTNSQPNAPASTGANAAKVLILLGSSSDMSVTEGGIKVLKQLKVTFSLRICSAHRAPERLGEIVRTFEEQGGQLFICLAGMSAHLAGVVASLTLKPVLAVPIFRAETAGLDALLSMGQMPKGVPVSTMSLGSVGFVNAALTAAQIFALNDRELALHLKDYRASMLRDVVLDDDKNRQEYRD